MAEEIVAEAVAGVAVQGILQAIKSVIKFKSILENLTRTVQSLRRNINRIAQLNESDEVQQDILRLVLLLEQAEDVIIRCSRIAWWNYFKKYRYSKKLSELEASLHRASTDLLPSMWENILRIQVEIIKLNQRLERTLQERDTFGRILKRRKTEVLSWATRMNRILQSLTILIHPYLSRFLGIHWRGLGYQRITSSFCPNSGYGK